MILFAPYIIAVTAGEGVKTVVSMLPIVSTMLMPARLAEGDVPLWQLVVAIAVTVISAVLLVRVSARIYERTLLRTGNRIGFRDAFRSARDEAPGAPRPSAGTATDPAGRDSSVGAAEATSGQRRVGNGRAFAPVRSVADGVY